MIKAQAFPPAAWKLGGTNSRSQSHFRNSEPLYGKIYDASVYGNGDLISYQANTCLELELAVVVPKEIDEPLSFLLCFEVPEKRLPSWQIDRSAVLNDRCGANVVVLQREPKLVPNELVTQDPFFLRKNGQILEESSLANLVHSPRELLRQFMNVSFPDSDRPTTGDIVALGGLGNCHEIHPGDTFSASNKHLGELQVNFRIGMT